MLTPSAAEPTARTPIARTSLSPTSDRAAAPAGRVAPTSDSEIAPTTDSAIADARGGEIPPASASGVAPTSASAPGPVGVSRLEEIISQVVPAVAAVTAGASRGTGFFIAPDKVLTNAHVVEGHSSVRLQAGKASCTARVAVTSIGADLAIARALEGAARESASIDDDWSRYVASCVSDSVPSGDRPWFSVFEPNGVTLGNRSNIDCRGWLDEVTADARPVRTAVARATEAARRSGVYPGAMRDLRRRHRMEWSGWER